MTKMAAMPLIKTLKIFSGTEWLKNLLRDRMVDVTETRYAALGTRALPSLLK